MRASVQQALEKGNGDFAKTTAFEVEKPALSLTTFRDPTHNNCARMRITRSMHTPTRDPAGSQAAAAPEPFVVDTAETTNV